MCSIMLAVWQSVALLFLLCFSACMHRGTGCSVYLHPLMPSTIDAVLQEFEGQLAAATAELQDKLAQQAAQLRSQGNELRNVCTHRDDYDRAYRALEKEQVAEANEAQRKLCGLSGKLAAVQVGVVG
jgi:hypothetical protein